MSTESSRLAWTSCFCSRPLSPPWEWRKLARLTVPKFVALKAAGKKICMLTAYDYTMARLLDQAGVDSILVGDSMAMVVQGHETTLPVTTQEMLYHAELVGRAVERALVIVDIPF